MHRTHHHERGMQVDGHAVALRHMLLQLAVALAGMDQLLALRAVAGIAGPLTACRSSYCMGQTSVKGPVVRNDEVVTADDDCICAFAG